MSRSIDLSPREQAIENRGVCEVTARAAHRMQPPDDPWRDRRGPRTGVPARSIASRCGCRCDPAPRSRAPFHVHRSPLVGHLPQAEPPWGLPWGPASGGSRDSGSHVRTRHGSALADLEQRADEVLRAHVGQEPVRREREPARSPGNSSTERRRPAPAILHAAGGSGEARKVWRPATPTVPRRAP